MCVKRFIAFLLVVAGLSLLTTGCEQKKMDPRSGVINLQGTWNQKASGIPGAVMTAVVSENSIQIILNTGSGTDSPMTALYWQGTFNPTKGSQTSSGDQQAMDDSIVGSEDTTKTFTYDAQGDIDFPFSILGMSTTVEMAKGAQ